MIIRSVGLTACTLVFVVVASLGTSGSSVERAEAGDVLTELSMSPVSNIEPAGSDVEIDVLLENVTDFGAYELDIAYDPNVLQFERWEEQVFLVSTGRTQVCQAPSLPSPGIVVLACSTLERGPRGATGSGVIGELTFSTSCSGQSMITFSNTTISDTAGSDIAHGQSAGSFVLLTPAVDSEPCLRDSPTPEQPDEGSPTPTPTPTLPPTDTPVPPTPTPADGCGDVNDSGTVDAVDAALILFKVAGLAPNVPNPDHADVDGNGRLDSLDVLKILQVSAGLIDRGALRCS